MSQQANDPFMEEQEHVQALLESTRGELQNAVRQWEYYRDKTVEYSIANGKFAGLSRYALSELRHVMRLLSEGAQFDTARAHIRGLIRRFESVPPVTAQINPSHEEREKMLRAALIEFVRIESNFGHTGQHKPEECADCKRVLQAHEALGHGYLK